jgi:hypothetical protein
MLADGLVKRVPWPRGLLTGLFSFACATGASALLAPHDSLRYWTSKVFAFAGDWSLECWVWIGTTAHRSNE